MSACCLECPGCKATLVRQGEAELDQSGDIYLPARIYEAQGCPRQAYVTLRIPGDPWVSRAEARTKMGDL